MFPQGPNLDAAATKAASISSNIDISYVGLRMAQIFGSSWRERCRFCWIWCTGISLKFHVFLCCTLLFLTVPFIWDFLYLPKCIEYKFVLCYFHKLNLWQVTKDGHAVIFHDDHIIIDNKVHWASFFSFPYRLCIC